MKKTILIDKDDKFFTICSDGEEITKINIDSLTLSGKDLYFNLFDKIDLDEDIDLNIQSGTNILDSHDIFIFEQLKGILHGISKKIDEKNKEALCQEWRIRE